MNTTNVNRLFALALAASLAACGGGSGASSAAAPAAASPAPPNAPAPAPAPATNPDLVTSVTAPTYAAGSTEKGGWDLLMAQRSSCGFGLLQQDTRLDVASAAHTFYLVQNSLDRFATVLGLYEDPTYAHFYAADWDARAAKAGFPFNVTEILDQSGSLQASTAPAPLTAGETLGAQSMRTLIETVYHARGAFWAGRSGGIGATLATGPSSFANVNQTQFRLVADVSMDSNTQKLGSATVASWPCAGLTGVRGTFKPANEAPNPFPDVTDTAVTYGTPIYFKADAGGAMVISTSSVTKVADGSTLVLRQLNKANDPAAKIASNEVFLVPTTALTAGSDYKVDVTGTLNGTAFTKSFTFSTAL